MTKHIALEQLIELVDGDRELVASLIEEGIIAQHDDGFGPEDVDRALTSVTLIREFEVNLAGVDIILRLRQELAAARQRLAELEGEE